jgi:hypothetical protein
MTKETYRSAYEAAKLDLANILREFEQLRLRKDQFEKLVEALKPVVEPVAGQPETKAAGQDLSRYPWSGR